MITKYSLNFYGLGVKTKQDTFKVYLRYLYTDKGKRFTKDIPTEYDLTKPQIELLNEDKLFGKVQTELKKKKSFVITEIDFLRQQNNLIKNYDSYPTAIELINQLKIMENKVIMNIDDYLPSFLSTLTNSTEPTKKKYTDQLKVFFDLIQNDPLFKTMQYSTIQLLSPATLEYYCQHLQAKKHSIYKGTLVKKELSENSIHNYESIAHRYLNFIASQLKISPIIYNKKRKLDSEKLHLKPETFDKLVNFDLLNANISKGTRESLQNIQNLCKFNSYLGLRINELLNIKASQITVFEKYIQIIIIEYKKNKPRPVIVKDEEPISILKMYLATNNEYPFKLFTYNHFDTQLKKLAEISGLGEIEMMNLKTQKFESYKIAEIISSHAIRRYGINQNLKRYNNLNLVRQFSGHKDMRMITKHYSDTYDSNELFGMMINDSK